MSPPVALPASMSVGAELARQGRWAEAESCFRSICAEDPSNKHARHSLATALLALGHYREGFSLYAMRRELPHFAPAPRLPCPEWQGEPLAGKHILLFPEQGLGDQIQFARFAPDLAARGADVTLFCAPVLERCFASLGVRCIAASGRVDFPEPDYWAFSMDVPARLGLNLEDIPNHSYLSGRPMTARGGIGIVRRGNPAHANDANRSLPDDLILPFPATSLAPQDTGAQDMQDTADRIAELSLVVSVDTSVAHLAGAMGKKTFVLLPDVACDWRWMRDRDDSPWYPSVTLFRQRSPGDWSEVLDRVAGVLDCQDLSRR